MPLAQRYGMALLPWSPLAGGILAGRYNDAASGPDGLAPGPQRAREPLRRSASRGAASRWRAASRSIARERGLTASQLALLWCKDQPGITAPIIGPRTMEQLRDALAVLDLDLGGEDAARLDALNGPGNAVSDFHNSNAWMKARVRDEAPA